MSANSSAWRLRFLSSFSILAMGALLPACGDSAQSADSPDSADVVAQDAFMHDPLPYSFDGLEPVIDTWTMELHHGAHHAGQYANLNRLAREIPELAEMGMEEILGQVSSFPVGVRNNAGGAWNHDFFWLSMAPEGERGEPSEELLAQIEADFGSLDEMKEAFNQGGAGVFGSGWVWLIVTDGGLAITGTPNQDNPLMDVAETRGTPILGNDVWEHAYYLNYQNRRGEYLENWWQVVNWNMVNQRFDAAR